MGSGVEIVTRTAKHGAICPSSATVQNVWTLCGGRGNAQIVTRRIIPPLPTYTPDRASKSALPVGRTITIDCTPGDLNPAWKRGLACTGSRGSIMMDAADNWTVTSQLAGETAGRS